MATAEQIKMRKGVLKYHAEHPGQHDQSHVAIKGGSCGTTMCIAGTALHLANMLEWDRYPSGSVQYGDVRANLKFAIGEMGSEESAYDEWIEGDEDVDPFLYYGGKLLGLDHDGAYELFYCFNDSLAMERLRQLADEQPTEITEGN